MSSTLLLSESELPMTEPVEIRERLEHDVDLIIDGGFCGIEPTTVIDLINGAPKVLRAGKGEIDSLAGY
jgi:tRNA A37 threonylcarbamoyladenosine synthetase subunit TsaC/SUA5/YrdC